jgi:DNA integrity scanning protein DisA with diadenylate cyclase activity
VVRYFRFLSQTQEESNLNLKILINSCDEMAKSKMGAIIVLQKNNSLDFTLNESNYSKIQLTPQVLESIFFKNSPLHDGAIVIKNNIIIATRVILPVSDKSNIPSRYGLRHRAALGITEKTDALVLVISEQTGKIVYFKNGSFYSIDSLEALKKSITQDLSN